MASHGNRSPRDRAAGGRHRCRSFVTGRGAWTLCRGRVKAVVWRARQAPQGHAALGQGELLQRQAWAEGGRLGWAASPPTANSRRRPPRSAHWPGGPVRRRGARPPFSRRRTAQDRVRSVAVAGKPNARSAAEVCAAATGTASDLLPPGAHVRLRRATVTHRGSGTRLADVGQWFCSVTSCQWKSSSMMTPAISPGWPPIPTRMSLTRTEVPSHTICDATGSAAEPSAGMCRQTGTTGLSPTARFAVPSTRSSHG